MLVPAGAAAILFGVIVGALHRQESVFSRGINDGIDHHGEVRPIAEVAELTRSLKLITVEIESSVRVEMKDSNWRGTARATLETPVRYLYGVDLAKLEHSAFDYLPLLERYQIRVPRPRRLAAEVITSNPMTEEIKTTGLRPFAGAMQMTLARRAVYDEACRQMLSTEQAESVLQQSKEQLEAVLQRFLGRSCRID